MNISVKLFLVLLNLEAFRFPSKSHAPRSLSPSSVTCPKKIGVNSLVQVVLSDPPTIHFTEFFPFFSTVQNFETQC